MTVRPGDTTIGFIGLGIMGGAMAGHLQQAGYALHVYTRTADKARPLTEKGAVWHDTPGALAAAADVVITMVGYPRDVEDVYLSPGGIIDKARPGTILIDMTTSEPTLAERIHAKALERELRALDAPVSGGDVGAREARLSIMVGGDAAVFEEVRPLFECMGKTIVLQGGPGAGQHTKMCNQIAVAGTMLGVSEALGYAARVGLDPSQVLSSIGTGAAGSFLMSNLGPKMIEGDFAPGFFVHHFVKDMAIALKEAEARGLGLPGLAAAKAQYDLLAAAGGAEDGTQALYRVYAGLAGSEDDGG